MNRPTREDFFSKEDWLRFCHEGGLDPYEEGANDLSGPGPYEQLLAGVFGSTQRRYERAWGARGLAEKLTHQQVRKAYRAVAFANCLGRVLNVSMSVTWSTVGKEGGGQVAVCQHRFLELMRKWFHRRKSPALWIWVLERGKKYGLHSHLLLSVPWHLKVAFRDDVEAMLVTAVGCPLLKTPASKTLKMEMRSHLTITPQWEWFKYMMKGVDPNLAWRRPSGEHLKFHVKLDIKARKEGAIQLKRIGVARALDEAAFRRWSAVNGFPSMQIELSSGALFDSRYIEWFRENQGFIAIPSRDAGETAKNGISLLANH